MQGQRSFRSVESKKAESKKGTEYLPCCNQLLPTKLKFF
ncbi:hypothetical protein BD94_0425 [Elizabethkingia anophelis NUHP1]|uniref:Uncharacterized protein n=1 Tax=Elizabethkingia anophelis NUHP1 TaxID=1338011 RepID=A0A077EFB5_9FLAO|nr:hypothetical protein BD94_0425 [Elizabethkingia anophelis NUHP1]